MLPIGIESFEEMRMDGFYYVDKTAMIGELLHRRGKVNLFTRPRRFGKSLNMAMLKSFFEIGHDKALFEGLNISKQTALCERYMGKFPVISISMKSVDGRDYETARALLCSIVGEEALRFHDILESDKITDEEKKIYKQLIKVDETGENVFAMSDAVLMGGLKTLSGLLEKHYGSKVIILIDEYDVPLAKANERGYYDEMISMVRNMFERALKTNDSLYFAVLTGCLRVSKESVFTGLNNFNIFSITSFEFDSCFGFTDGEVREMLEYYGLGEKYDMVKEWYDGYRFGDADVYCPWDVINYVSGLMVKRTLSPQNYWINTSSNDVVKKLLEKSTSGTRKEIECLIAGESITKVINEELTYKELYDDVENVWSVLFTTGYLTQRGRMDEELMQYGAAGKTRRLVIPNREIHNIFMMQIRGWMQNKAREDGEKLNAFCDAFKNADAKAVQTIFREYLKQTISIRDTAVRIDLKENLPTGKATAKGLKVPNPSVCFYHGFLLGLLRFKSDWQVTSNRESGEGYADIMVEIDAEDIGIVIELKYAENGNLENECKAAMWQIEEKEYARQLYADGMNKIIKCGMACHTKNCKVVFEVLENCGST